MRVKDLIELLLKQDTNDYLSFFVEGIGRVHYDKIHTDIEPSPVADNMTEIHFK